MLIVLAVKLQDGRVIGLCPDHIESIVESPAVVDGSVVLPHPIVTMQSGAVHEIERLTCPPEMSQVTALAAVLNRGLETIGARLQRRASIAGHG